MVAGRLDTHPSAISAVYVSRSASCSVKATAIGNSPTVSTSQWLWKAKHKTQILKRKTKRKPETQKRTVSELWHETKTRRNALFKTRRGSGRENELHKRSKSNQNTKRKFRNAKQNANPKRQTGKKLPTYLAFLQRYLFFLFVCLCWCWWNNHKLMFLFSFLKDPIAMLILEKSLRI